MTDTTDTTKTIETTDTVTVEPAPVTPPVQEERRSPLRQRRGPRREREERPRSEFDQVTLDVRRVARVVAGGRRFSFSVAVVIGDRKGRVGVGTGKGADTALAIDKAARDAKKNLVTIARTEKGSIPHAVRAKYASSDITLVPSPDRGVVAGSAVRTILELAGVHDVVAKILTRSKNKLSIARATVVALESARTR